MMTIPTINQLDSREKFIIETDALSTGIGVVLMQKSRPLAYFSQALKGQARLKSVYEREPML